MRQWHRWIGICCAVFLLVIGGTGVAIQVLDLAQAKSKPEAPALAPGSPAPVAAGNVVATAAPSADKDADEGEGEGHRHHKHHDTVAAAGDSAQPDAQATSAPKPKKPQSPLRQWSHWIKDLHSGVLLGPIGIFVSIVSGLALVFFAGSGMWMYWQMFTRRKAAGRASFFWKK